MTKFIFIFLLTANWTGLLGQTFQGKIVYKVGYQYKDSTTIKKLGTLEELFIKNGDYLIKTNGTDVEWKLYKNKTNLIYIKHKNIDTLYTINAGFNNDTIKEVVHYKNTGTHVNNLKYSEYIFFTTSGMQYFYYSKKLKMNYTLFKIHKYDFLSEFLNRANYIPLIFVNSTTDNWFEKEAITVEEKTLSDDIFIIPKGLIIKN